MNDFFLNILQDPQTGETLRLNTGDGKLESAGGNQFDVKDDVPRMITGTSARSNSQVHRDMKSDFNYREHYERDAEVFNYFDPAYDSATQSETHRLRQTIMRQVPAATEIILDVGCGDGWLARHFLPDGKKVISMDISSINPVRIHKEVNNPNHLGLVADVFALPIKKNSVDVIVASEIIEHVANPKQFISILHETLKPGGRLIVTTPYNEKIDYHLCVHCNKPTPSHAHIHSFNEKNISKLIPQEANWRWRRFSNKYLTKMRSHKILNLLGYPAWRFADKFANALFPKQERMMIMIEKNVH